MKILKKIFSILLRIGISAALLVFIFRKVDAQALFGIIRRADKPLLVISFIFFFLNYVFCLYRWEMLLRGAGIHLSLKRVIISLAGGNFFNLFLPSTIGGDVMRSVDLAVHTKRPHEVVATVVLDRLSGYAGLVIVGALALALGGNLVREKSILLSFAVIAGILVAILVALFNRFLYAKINQLLHSPTAGKIRQAFRDLHHEMHIFRNRRGVLFGNLILSMLVQAVSPLTFYLIALSLGIKINIIYYFVFLPIIGAITLLPISIGGLGLRDATTIYFFAKAGVSKDLAFAMSLLAFFFIFTYAVLGGVIYVLTLRHRRMQYHPSPHFPHPAQKHA
jgi:uncharacterized protein (TIRG00374 family)